MDSSESATFSLGWGGTHHGRSAARISVPPPTRARPATQGAVENGCALSFPYANLGPGSASFPAPVRPSKALTPGAVGAGRVRLVQLGEPPHATEVLPSSVDRAPRLSPVWQLCNLRTLGAPSRPL